MRAISFLLGAVFLAGGVAAFIFLVRTSDEEVKQKQEQAAKEVERAYQEASETGDSEPETVRPRDGFLIRGDDISQDDPTTVGAEEQDAEGETAVDPAAIGKVQVQLKEGRIQGNLDRSMVDRVIKRHRAQLQHCYFSKRSQKRSSTQGQIAIQFIISQAGSVTSVAVTSSTLKDSNIEQCIQRAVRRWNFPSPKGGIVVANYIFEFSE